MATARYPLEPSTVSYATDATQPHLQRRLGLVQATALNMVNMVGVGPFITIPILLTALGGPQAMLGWIVAALICIPDGMIWSELGAAMPGSGGSYVYLREGYGRHTWGRLMAFLFIWQFVVSGPLEIASGYIGFSKYLSFVWPAMGDWHRIVVGAGVGLLNILLLFRGITSIGRLTVAMWIGMLLTTGFVIVTGIFHFDSKVAFDFPPNAFKLSGTFLFALGAAARIGIYDYLGYYDVCYIGEEVRDPGRVIPRSIITSLVGIATVYFLMNLSIIGTISWREFVPANARPNVANYVVSIMMEHVYGRRFAILFTGMILLTTYGSVFALLLGYSRIPYAAALDGCFFQAFAQLHPKQKFPHVSLLVVGAVAMLACALPLDAVIDALVTCRILVQFMGQIFAVILLRRRRPDIRRPYRVWLYPLPCFIALTGWLFVFATAGKLGMLVSLGTLASGLIAFAIWARATRRWPFAAPETT